MLLYNLLICRKAIKKARTLKTVAQAMATTQATIEMSEVVLDQIDEVVRNAAGYGWEVCQQGIMMEVLSPSPENPFLDPNWQQYVFAGE